MLPAILQLFFCALISGVAQAFGISNEFFLYGSPFLGLFCLVPMYFCAYRTKSYGQAFFLFASQVLTVHIISSFWLANFHGYAAFTLGASALGTAFEGGLCGIILHALPHKENSESPLSHKNAFVFGRIAWFASCWVLYEFIKSNGTLGYPWGTVSMTSYKWHLLTQIADLGGVYTITFLFSMFSGLVSECLMALSFNGIEIIRKDRLINLKKTSLFVTGLFVFSILYGLIQYVIPRTIEKEMNIVMVQQNIDPWEAEDDESIVISKRLTEQGCQELNKKGYIPDVILWSEGVLTKNYPTARYFYEGFPPEESLTQFIRKTGVPFIIGGGVTVDTSKTHKKTANSAILYDKDGKFSGFYSKIQLVPFAEKIPYYDNPLMKFFMKDIVGLYTTMQSGYQIACFKIPLSFPQTVITPLDYKAPSHATISLDINGKCDQELASTYLKNPNENPYGFVTFSTPICFEDAFPSVCRKLYKNGSEIFLNITNDSWSKTKSSEIQHFIVASFRAMEFRTTLARCTNSGYTAVIDPTGKIIGSLPLFEEGVLAQRIPVYKREATLYAIFGDWFAILLIICILAYIGRECFIEQNLKVLFWKKAPITKKQITETENSEQETSPLITDAKTTAAKRTRRISKTSDKKSPAKKSAVKKSAVKKSASRKESAEKKTNTAKTTTKKTAGTSRNKKKLP